MQSNPESRHEKEEIRSLLSGLAPQERKPLLGIKIADLYLGNVDVFTGTSTRRWDGVTRNGIVREVDFRGGCASEALMGSDEGVVSESESESLLKLVENERFESLECKALFQRSPQSFDECDGTGFANGAEAVQDAELFDAVAKLLRDELTSLVGDKVTRHAEALDGGLEEAEDGLRCRFLPEHTRGEWKAGEAV